MIDAPAPVPNARPIERRAKISREEFYRDYLTPPGKPVIITDAMDDWPARTKWTFDYFRDRCGDDRVWVGYDIRDANAVKRVRLRDFLDYVENPISSPLAQFAAYHGMVGKRLYLFTYKPFRDHPETRADFGELYFCDNWYQHVRPPLSYWLDELLAWAFIGPAGTFTKLHIDLLGTHAYLGQIVGRKRCVFYSPEDSAHLANNGDDPTSAGDKDVVNPWKPDLARFPNFQKAVAYEGDLNPGELAFFPRGWWHQVLALTPSITVSLNIINETNFHEHLTDLLRLMPHYLMDPRLRGDLGLPDLPPGLILDPAAPPPAMA